jgi:oxalate decarboxylase/phosphoglucose isomerase-like protein (cupin superfamily)
VEPLKAVKKNEAEVFDLPGRSWLHYVGPSMNGAKNITVGFSEFPGGSAPEGHVHPTQEEVIYIISGKGKLVSPENTVELEPGTVVYIPNGTHHQTVNDGTEPLTMVTSFSPPVVPGSYED